MITSVFLIRTGKFKHNATPTNVDYQGLWVFFVVQIISFTYFYAGFYSSYSYIIN